MSNEKYTIESVKDVSTKGSHKLLFAILTTNVISLTNDPKPISKLKRS